VKLSITECWARWTVASKGSGCEMGGDPPRAVGDPRPPPGGQARD
jgi:hypothetical protein